MSEVGLEGPRRGAATLARCGALLEHWIDSRPVRAFACLTAFYVIIVAVLSSFKLLWLDELITLHIARLPSVAAIWDALGRGSDPNPPITHILVHYSRLLFGDYELALRLPALVGYWIGMLSLFAYLVRRVPGTWALAGTVLSMSMAAFDYSYESRSYAIFYGLAMLAMLCWCLMVDPSSRPSVRRVAFAGMVLALAAGISTNYFAVLAFLPIAAGEIVRTIRKLILLRPGLHGRSASLAQAVDFRIWIGLAVAGSTLLAYRVMIAHSIAQFAPYAWNKVSLNQVFDSYTEMVEVVLYPILALFFFAAVVFFIAWQLAPVGQGFRTAISRCWIASVFFPHASGLRVPVHEAVAVLAFMAYPVLGYIVASIRGGMLSPRFVIPVCFGFSIAAIFIAFRLFGELSSAATVLLGLCLAWFIARESVVGYWYEEQKQCFFKVVDSLPRAEKAVPRGAPIVIPDPLLALTFQHYAPPAYAARIVFPVDFPAIRAFRRDDSPEENLWAGRSFLYALPIIPLAAFQHSAGRYLVVADDGNWLIRDLVVHRYIVHRLSINTRAVAIGGFTPLAHGTPVFFTVCGDALPGQNRPAEPSPLSFHVSDNLPNSNAAIPDEIVRE